jgi:hypothetical protein
MNLTSRVKSKAAWGAIFVSPATRAALLAANDGGGAFRVEARGDHLLKGKGMVRMYEVAWASADVQVGRASSGHTSIASPLRSDSLASSSQGALTSQESTRSKLAVLGFQLAEHLQDRLDFIASVSKQQLDFKLSGEGCHVPKFALLDHTLEWLHRTRWFDALQRSVTSRSLALVNWSAVGATNAEPKLDPSSGELAPLRLTFRQQTMEAHYQTTTIGSLLPWVSLLCLAARCATFCWLHGAFHPPCIRPAHTRRAQCQLSSSHYVELAPPFLWVTDS